MLPSSHPAPINFAPRGGDAHLADAFKTFTAAAGRLEHSYQELQKEVSQLRHELQQERAALALSMEENERMRVALGRILDALPCGVIVVNADDERIILMNPQAHRLLRTDPQKTSTLRDLPPRVRMALKAKRQSVEQEEEQDVCLHSSDQKWWLAIRSTRMDPVASADRSRGKTIVIVRDITAHREAECEREAMRNMVALSEISTLLAHEIRNPLGIMELFADLLVTDGSLCGEPLKWVGHLQTGIRSLAATVNNVLQFHTLETPELTPIRLGPILEGAFEFIRPLASQAGAMVELEDQLVDAQIAANPNGLQQVILNLACNAFRHMPHGGTFRICAKRQTSDEGMKVAVTFTDTGKWYFTGTHRPDFPAWIQWNGPASRAGFGSVPENYSTAQREH